MYFIFVVTFEDALLASKYRSVSVASEMDADSLSMFCIAVSLIFPFARTFSMAVWSFSLPRRPTPGTNVGLLDAVVFSVSPGVSVLLPFVLSVVLFALLVGGNAAPPPDDPDEEEDDDELLLLEELLEDEPEEVTVIATLFVIESALVGLIFTDISCDPAVAPEEAAIVQDTAWLCPPAMSVGEQPDETVK